MNRFEADVRRLRTVREEPNKGATGGTVYRAELVYSSDLDSVLSLLKK
jgi:hypothetical protein